MEVNNMSKDRMGAKVLFPRTQLAGLTCEDESLIPSRQDFDVETVNDVPNMGTAKLIVQQHAPHMVFQLFETESEEQFDDFLGKLLGMHDIPSYVAGRTDFMVLFSGSRDGQQVTQANHEEVYLRICATQDAAARWWHVYGKGDI